MSSSNTEDTNMSSSESDGENSIDKTHTNERKIALMRMAKVNIVKYFMTYVLKSPCRTSTLTGHQ